MVQSMVQYMGLRIVKNDDNMILGNSAQTDSHLSHTLILKHLT